MPKIGRAEREHYAFQYGTNADYEAYCRKQPCAICGNWAEYHAIKGYLSQFCHVRDAGNAGTGYKPPFSGHPGCGTCHNAAHQHGEAWCLKNNLGGEWTRESAHEWFKNAARESLECWIESLGS